MFWFIAVCVGVRVITKQAEITKRQSAVATVRCNDELQIEEKNKLKIMDESFRPTLTTIPH